MLVCDAPVTMAVVTVAVVTVAVGPACRELTIACLVLCHLVSLDLPALLVSMCAPARVQKPSHSTTDGGSGSKICQSMAGEFVWLLAGMGECCRTLSHSHIQSGAHWAGSTFRSAWCSIQLYNDGGDGNRQVSTARRVSALQGGPCASQGRPCERRVLCRKEGRPAGRLGTARFRIRSQGWVSLCV